MSWQRNGHSNDYDRFISSRRNSVTMESRTTPSLPWFSRLLRRRQPRLGSLAVALNSPSSSEGAVPRSWSVNPTRLTCRNEPDSDDLCRDGAFISDDVHVVATGVNKRHPRCVHVRRAVRIV